MLSLGSVVYLKDGNQPILIIGRGQIITVNDIQYYCDYTGCSCPEGITPNGNLYFNEENVDEVLFEGWHNEAEDRYSSILKEKIGETDIPRLNVVELLEQAEQEAEKENQTMSELFNQL